MSQSYLRSFHSIADEMETTFLNREAEEDDPFDGNSLKYSETIFILYF